MFALTVVVVLALLLRALGSVSVALTEAVAVRVPPAVGVVTTVTVRVLPEVTLLDQVQVTVCPAVVQVPLELAEALPMVELAGAVKVRLALVAAEPPPLKRMAL